MEEKALKKKTGGDSREKRRYLCKVGAIEGEITAVSRAYGRRLSPGEATSGNLLHACDTAG